jgi:hypothetical protein
VRNASHWFSQRDYQQFCFQVLILIFSFPEVQDFIERRIGSGYNKLSREEKTFTYQNFSV